MANTNGNGSSIDRTVVSVILRCEKGNQVEVRVTPAEYAVEINRQKHRFPELYKQFAFDGNYSKIFGRIEQEINGDADGTIPLMENEDNCARIVFNPWSFNKAYALYDKLVEKVRTVGSRGDCARLIVP